LVRSSRGSLFSKGASEMMNFTRPGRCLGWKTVALAVAVAPLFQIGGCSLLDPQNLLRIGIGALLFPVNTQVFDFFASLGGGG